MIDSEFDDFARSRLGDHEVPVPAGLWDKVADKQFDQFISGKLKDGEAAVPETLWDKISDAQFDGFVGNTLAGIVAPVPDGLWDRINDGQFDNFFSDKLSGYEASVPAGLWEKIMPEKDDDTAGWVWFRSPARAVALLALLVGLLGGGYYWFRTAETVPVSETTVPAATPTPADVQKTDNNSLPVTSDQRAATPAENTGNTNPAGKTAGIPEQPSENKVKPGNTTDANSSVLVRSGAGRNNTPGNLVLTNKPAKQPGNNIVPPIAETGGTTVLTKANENETGFEFIEPYRTNHLSASPIPFSRREMGMIDKKLSPNHANSHRSVIICPSDKGRNTDWYIEGYLSPDFAFSSVSSNTASQQYMMRKDSSESMNPGFTAGLRLAKPITDNIWVKTGLQFTQMNQKYVYRTENEEKITTVVTRRTIINPDGTTTVVTDTSQVREIGFKNNTVVNRFRSLDIPVMVGYQFGTKEDDLRVGINAGVIVNLSSWYEGVMLDSTMATVPITKGNSNMIYKSRVGLGLYGGVSISKKLSDDMQVFAEPYFRYNLSNMTTPNAPYNQKFSLGGISLGVRINLNRQ
jgi:hypothetical protein